MQHEPSGLLGDVQGAMNLPRTDAVLGIGNHPDGRKPLLQGKRRVLKNRADFGGKLTAWMLGLALPTALSRKEVNIGTTAGRANYALGPAFSGHAPERIVRIGKGDDCFL